MASSPATADRRPLLRSRRARYQDFGDPRLNQSGQVVFFARLDSGVTGIFTGGDPTTDLIADDSGLQFDGFGDGPTINDAGLVAFRGFLETTGESGLFTGDGGPVTMIVDTSGDLSRSWGRASTMPGIAFRADLDSGDEGLFGGPDPAADRILLEGDALDGGIVVDIEFFRGLNNNGSVAFLARFSDGREGIYRADLVAQVRNLPFSCCSLQGGWPAAAGAPAIVSAAIPSAVDQPACRNAAGC